MSAIPPELQKKIRHIEIRTAKKAQDQFVGNYHSAFKGQGMEFEEFREYRDGDDIRRIDWNVSARMQDPQVRVHKEERELTVIVAVDLSSSGELGSADQSKRELMAEFASVLAFSAMRNNDRIGLMLFTDQVEKFVKPGKGRQHVLRIIRDILFFDPVHHGTDIKEALGYLDHVLNNRAIVFLLSDFMDSGFEQRLKVTGRKHDLVAVVAVDGRELELPKVGWVTFRDAENGDAVEVNTSSGRVRKRFAEAAKKRLDDLSRSFRVAGVDSIHIETGKPYDKALRSFFQNRVKRH